jgi:hypothetical protein
MGSGGQVVGNLRLESKRLGTDILYVRVKSHIADMLAIGQGVYWDRNAPSDACGIEPRVSTGV